jgi:hypothetical protein
MGGRVPLTHHGSVLRTRRVTMPTSPARSSAVTCDVSHTLHAQRCPGVDTRCTCGVGALRGSASGLACHGVVRGARRHRPDHHTPPDRWALRPHPRTAFSSCRVYALLIPAPAQSCHPQHWLRSWGVPGEPPVAASKRPQRTLGIATRADCRTSPPDAPRAQSGRCPLVACASPPVSPRGPRSMPTSTRADTDRHGSALGLSAVPGR